MAYRRLSQLLASTSPAALLGLALSSAIHPAAAQSYGNGPVQIPTISVQDTAQQQNYRTDSSSLPKLTQPLLDTPHSIDVVPQQLMKDQGVTTLRDALRNVTGVSLAAGEAGAQGDNLTLRGFTARNDIYLDGMRDFGSYYRDPFFLEDVEVLKGPASILFGRGSTGGVIEQDSKLPKLEGFTNSSVQFGTDMTKRMTADIDRPIGGLGTGAAFRINLMAHDSNVAGRDTAEFSRFGIAPTLALGMGTDTRITLSYLHQTEYDTPDYGLPWVFSAPSGVKNATATPLQASRSNFYGFASNDYLRTNADIATGKIEHDINDSITVRDQLRYAHYTRQFRITEPQINATAALGASGAVQLVPPNTPTSSLLVSRNQLAGTSLETFLQNQADFTAKFPTGFVDHTFVGGIEVGEETSDPRRFTTVGPFSTTSAVAPNSGQPFNSNIYLSSSTKTDAATAAVYALDTLKLNDQWQLMVGGRLDRFDATYYQQAFPNPNPNTGANATPYTALQHTDDMASWRGGIVYKPAPNGSVYFDIGTSFNPSAEALSTTAGTNNLAPEKTKTYEVGTKWDLFHDAFSVRGAIYRTQKGNVKETDPNNSANTILAGDARVDGFEIEGAGHLTESWQIYAGYSYMFSEIDSSPVTGAGSDLGNRLANVPMHTFNLWSTYTLPFWNNMEIGGGMNYVSSRYANSTPRFVCSPAASSCTATTTGAVAFLDKLQGYATFSAMAKYYLNEHTDVQLNINNIFDKYYFDTIHPSHIVPGAGRTAMLTVDFKY